MLCAHSSCIEALERITGKKLGHDYASWKNWAAQTANPRMEADAATPSEGDASETE